jgi:D-mannonate dehydratase
MLKELIQAIDNLENEGIEEHEGPKIDLARVLRALVRIYQTRGIDYLIRSIHARKLIDKSKIRPNG